MAENGKIRAAELSEAHIKTLKDLLADLQYGSVTLVVQNGRLIQVEKYEKVRLV